MHIPARALQHRVKLLKMVLMDDVQGGFKENWLHVASAWALVTPLYTQGSKGDQARGIRLGGREIQSLGYKIILRNQFLKTEFQRVLWRDRVLALTTQPESDENQCYIVCYASALQGSEQSL